METKRTLVGKIDTARIERAIADAERRTSGEIRVSVARFFAGDIQRTAERAFVRLGMTATRARNAVLVFIVPSRRKFAIVGDRGIHERVGQSFWEELSGQLAAAFREEDYTAGLVATIRSIGERLAEHFPAVAGDNPDELPNVVDEAAVKLGP